MSSGGNPAKMESTAKKAGVNETGGKTKASVDTLVARRLADMCSYLGISETEKHLFWIAEMALVAKLPTFWKEYKDAEGHAYYHNHATGVTSWSHPRDAYFQELVDRERGKIKEMASFAEQQRKMKWDPDGTPLEAVELSNNSTTALNKSDGNYPTFRTTNKMSMGKHCLGLTIDSLQEDGYMYIGIGKENINYNTDAIPAEDYNCHGYTTVGEIYSAGRLIQTGKEKLRDGDHVTMVVDFTNRSIVWYRNEHPVGFLEGFEGSALFPCVVMGHKGYKVSIIKELQLPHLLMKWDPSAKHAGVTLPDSFTAKSNSPTGYATVRTIGWLDQGKPYFEMSIQVMARDGFVMVGVGNRDIHTSETQIPAEEFNHYGYASSGEAFVHGVRVRKDLPRIQRGDIVGFQIMFEEQRMVFYLNGKPVLELPDIATYEHYYPSVTFGNAGYTVRIHPTPLIPLGVPKWVEDSQLPPRYTLLQDRMVARCVKANQMVLVLADVQYENGNQYFEAIVEALHPEAELCIGVAFPSVKESYRVVPEAKHAHMGYMNNGDLVAFGKVFKTGAPKIRLPDRIGIMIEFAIEQVTFFNNGHPVGRYSSNYVRGKFMPVLTCVGPFEVHIDPTPAPPSLIPEWDPLRMQEGIQLSKDGMTAQVAINTESARTVWAATTYSSGVLYFELQVELHGRCGYLVYGVGNRNFAGDGKVQKRASLPLEEYYVVGYTSRGEIISAGAIERTGEEPWSNSDTMSMRIDFARETFAAYKNGHPVVVGNCTGLAVGVSPAVTFVYGPHMVRINPMPHVPPPPHRWDPELCNKHVKLSNYDLHAKNVAHAGYPTVVATSVLRFGKHYIELDVDYLPESGFMMLGVAGGPVHESLDRVPPAHYHHWGYSSSGEIWAHGVKEISGREDFMTGDTFGMLVDMDVGSLLFYKNGYPVGYYVGVEGAGITRGVRPCVTFGYTNYACSIRPTARTPDGSPRWDMVCKSGDIRVTRDHLTCTNTSYLTAPTCRGTSGYTEGKVFFEVRVNYVKLGGYLALGLGAHDIHQNTAVYPPEHYQFVGYTSMGELLMNGQIVNQDLPRIVSGDDMGIQADYDSGLIIFYKNRHPVGQLLGFGGVLYPAVIFTNENYSVTIHTNARERLEVPPFSRVKLNPKIRLEGYDMVASNTSDEGFPTACVTGKYRTGSFFFEVTIDTLSHGGFLLIGLGSLNVNDNNDYLPSEKFNSYSYSAAGELYALGEVVSAGHSHFEQGNVVGYICNLDSKFVVFYINNRQVAEIRNLAPHMEYTPFVVFGNGKFQVSINRVPHIAKLFAVNERQTSETNSSRSEAAKVNPMAR